MERRSGSIGEISEEDGVFTLCGVQGCCPTVDFRDPSKIVLKDDHGGQVTLTSDEWTALKKIDR